MKFSDKVLAVVEMMDGFPSILMGGVALPFDKVLALI